jgi:hypothetical protein
MLHRWKNQLAKLGDEASPGHGHLRGEAETLRQEREIPKNAENLYAVLAGWTMGPRIDR